MKRLLLALLLAAFAALSAASAPSAHGGMAGFPGRMGPVVAQYDTDAQAVFNAFTIAPTEARKQLINTAIVSLKSAGVWSKLDALWVMAAADSQAARINWKNPGTYTLTAVNSPTFTADQGYAGNGSSSYLTTGYNPGGGGSFNFIQNSASFGIWSQTESASTSVDISAYDGTKGVLMRLRNASNRLETRLNTSTTQTSTANNDSAGFTVATRSASGTYKYINATAGVSQTFSVSSATLANAEFAIGCLYSTGTPSGYSARQYSAAFIGGALTDDEVTALKNALATYRTGVGL